METEIYIGCNDNQTSEQKDKNYSLSEVCLAPAPVIWTERDSSQWKTVPTIRDQDGSGSCVCQTYATELAIIFEQKYGVWRDFSATYPYQQRSQPMQSGCTSVDIYTIFPKLGNLFERDMPSQLMNDSAMMAIKKEKYFDDIAKPFKVFRISSPLDFETCASTVQATGKGVMIWVKFHPEEWTDTPTIGNKPPTSGHSITVIDAFLVNGKKYLLIVDSWGKNYAIKGYRLISEEYFAARCFITSFLKTFEIQNNEVQPFGRPHFDGSIISAQKCFKWEGFFGANLPEIENWGPITRKACIDFQLRYNIEPALGNFGPITQELLYKLYK